MSSAHQQSCSHHSGIPFANGENSFYSESKESRYKTNVTLAGTEATGKYDTNFPLLRFNSRTVDELSKELHKRTEETQKLQEEVERATKLASERVDSTYNSNSKTATGFNSPKGSSCRDSYIQTAQNQAMAQSLRCALDGFNQEMHTQRHSSGKEVSDYAADKFGQEPGFRQHINKSNDQHLERAITKLQIKLQEVQAERDALSDLRTKDSKIYADQMEKMLSLLEDLQVTKRCDDQRLQETENEALVLCRKSLDMTEQYHGPAKQDERTEQLIASLGQEVATLTQKLSSWKRNNAALCVKVDLLKKQAEKQTSFHHQQLGELRLAVSHHKDKVSFLEQQFSKAQSEVEEAQRGRDLSSHQTESLQVQLSQLKLEMCQIRANVAQEREEKRVLQEKAVSLTVKMEELHKELEERRLLVSCLEQQLTKSQSQLEEAQRGRYQSSQETEMLNSQLNQLKVEVCEARENFALEKEKKSALQDQALAFNVHMEKLNKMLEDRNLLVRCLEQQLAKAQSKAAEVERTKDQSSQQMGMLQTELCQLKFQLCQACETLAKEREQRKSSQENAEALSTKVDELHKELQERSLLLEHFKKLLGAVKEDCNAQTAALRCGEEQNCGLQSEVRALREQMVVAQEQLNRAVEEKTCLQALLERRTHEALRTQQVLDEKEKQLMFRQQDMQQGLSRIEEVQNRCQILQTEGETLRLKLDDREKTVDILRLQVENSTQIATQNSCTIDRLSKDNSHLNSQSKQQKREIQQLTAELERQKAERITMEQQKQQLQASVVEQRLRANEGAQEKVQLKTQLEDQRAKLLALTKEHEELQRLHSCKNVEHQGVVAKLQNQLKNTYTELDQARSTVSALEGADGHGLQVATGMQKQITAKREQIDSLKGKIQQLEETMEKMNQEKHYQDLENQRRLQELAFINEEKKLLTTELESVQSMEKQCREKNSELELAVQKMTETLSSSNEIVQMQQQEICRLKLQHALDLKELRGQNARMTVTTSSPAPVTSAHSLSPSSTHASNATIKKRQGGQDSPTRELRSLVKELRGATAERPHTVNSTSISSLHGRSSAPERVQKTTLLTGAAKDVNVKMEAKACSSSPQLVDTPEVIGKKITHSHKGHCLFSPVPAGRRSSSPKLVSPTPKSPVHFLLTSDPNT